MDAVYAEMMTDRFNCRLTSRAWHALRDVARTMSVYAVPSHDPDEFYVWRTYIYSCPTWMEAMPAVKFTVKPQCVHFVEEDIVAQRPRSVHGRRAVHVRVILGDEDHGVVHVEALDVWFTVHVGARLVDHDVRVARGVRDARTVVHRDEGPLGAIKRLVRASASTEAMPKGRSS